RRHTRSYGDWSSDVCSSDLSLLDDPVEVDVDEIQSRRRAPVAQQPGLDVLALQRLLQQGIVVKINLADGQVVCRAPVSVHFPERSEERRVGKERRARCAQFR